MNRHSLISILLAFFVPPALVSQQIRQPADRLIPTPQSLIVTQSRFVFGSTTKIILGVDNAEERFTAEQIQEALNAHTGPQLKVVAEQSLRRLTGSFLYIGSPGTAMGRRLLDERHGTLTAAMKAEGYFLDVDGDGIVIIGESPRGRFYGVMTLLQLIEQERNRIVVRGVRVADFPLESFRGVSDDISRGQISTLENFKKIIRFLARYKLNVYSPYIEDVFQFSHHPLIGRNRGAMSPREAKELDAYAKQYHVEIIPIFETLGHWENILSLPEYMHYAEFPGAHTLNVSDEKVYALLDEMIGEIASCFSSPYFNMAADESWDVGLGANRDRVAKSDLATVHAEHYKRVMAILAKYGKKPLMYGDVILNNPTILDQIPKNVTIVDWHYGASFDYTSPEVFQKAGFSYIVSPALWNFTGPYPNLFNSFDNIQVFNRIGFQHGSHGLLTSTWNDNGGEELRELNYIGYAWSAECAWQPLKAEASRFTSAFCADFFETKKVEELQSASLMLSDAANLVSWGELWRHPMLSDRNNDEPSVSLPQRVQSIETTMPFVLSLLNTARTEAKANRDQIDIMEFVAHLDLWFAKKIRTAEEVKDLCLRADAGGDRDSLSQVIVARCSGVVDDLAQLKAAFTDLWLRTNKAAGLELLQARYDRQIAYWNEKIDQVRHGLFSVDPNIESQWIAAPARPSSPGPSIAFFRKTFTVPKGLRAAQLQLIGDSYADAYVNGKEIGKVLARRSLSLTVESQRVKMFDILPLLADGPNVVAVEARNYSPNGLAGVNIDAQFRTVNDSLVALMSDSSWKVSPDTSAGWTTAGFNDSAWVPVYTRQRQAIIIRPDFATGRKSWIEH